MKKVIIVLGVIIAIIAIAFVGLRIYTKSFSPQETATYDKQGISLSVAYSRPYKHDRVIFGELVPYDEVWRTGANEATTFTTNTPLQIDGKQLPAGEYSIFTIPGEQQWEVIFNSETGQWGVTPPPGSQANRDPANDVLTVTVPAITSDDVFEQFTIAFEEMGDEIDLTMMWDQTMVVVPVSVTEE
jgi:hypothetical protein